jgi:polysaccharide export outer membrane protein
MYTKGILKMISFQAKWPLLFGPLMVIVLLSCTRYPEIPKWEVITKPEKEETPAFSRKVWPVVTPQGRMEEYKVGPEDVLQINVWGHEDLSREVQVSQTGDFNYPLIGSVKAAGLTVAQLEKEITGRLAEGYVVNPQVTVTVKEYRSKKVFVMGEVARPGIYPLTGPTTVMELLTKAGGPTNNAGAEILVIRPREPSRRSSPTTVEEADSGEIIRLSIRAIERGDISQNIKLVNGDTVIIPKAKYFFVFGEVNRTGKFKYEEGLTVLKAITLAGGITEKAAARRTKIIREKEGVRVEIPAKMSDIVLPNDIIVVPESFF